MLTLSTLALAATLASGGLFSGLTAQAVVIVPVPPPVEDCTQGAVTITYGAEGAEGETQGRTWSEQICATLTE